MSVETNDNNWDPEGSSEPFDGLSVSITSSLSGLVLELPSDTYALKKSNWYDQVVSNVMLNHIEENPTEVGRKSTGNGNTEHANNSSTEGSSCK